MPVGKHQNSTRGGKDLLGAADWVRAAREALIKHGVAGIKVDRLARQLRVTRGSFYWHFSSRSDLLEHLLQDWVATNTAPFERVLESGKDGRTMFQAIADLWLAEEEYDPRFDSAMRDWARASKSVARVVRMADNARIETLRSIFLRLGYHGREALVRARISYFHQVGYYALHITESSAARRKLKPYYIRALLGK